MFFLFPGRQQQAASHRFTNSNSCHTDAFLSLFALKQLQHLQLQNKNRHSDMEFVIKRCQEHGVAHLMYIAVFFQPRKSPPSCQDFLTAFHCSIQTRDTDSVKHSIQYQTSRSVVRNELRCVPLLRVPTYLRFGPNDGREGSLQPKVYKPFPFFLSRCSQSTTSCHIRQFYARTSSKVGSELDLLLPARPKFSSRGGRLKFVTSS